ncbi:Primosomal DnaI domain protein [Caldalkalibacillus thermarum TA2.A1]|uniref:Primosomal DnaI domain protein n=1 Tax=Caldalkalibacillus thermarum (strain TA2.A1) TaxID=986075 RepID=F5L959_CALTT|nr:primosomal protein DnaI [Caldalkalibacillus thermarum]EGL82133.1 Primosomal DnaI domain protein [Caldalkalibacillus thermarum TA2.A1]
MEAIKRSLEAFVKARNLEQKIQTDLSALLDHPLVEDWLSRHPQWTKTKLERFSIKVKHYIREEENCQKCPGLDRCPNLLKGHKAELLAYSGMVDVTYTPCRYQKRALQEARKAKLIKSHHISADILQGSFRHFDRNDAGRLDAFQAVLDFCMTVQPGKNPMGIYLYGPLGVGKSYLLGAAANKLAERDIATYMVYTPEFFREVKGAIAEQKVEEKVEALQKVPVLILDDIGAETISAWARDEVLGPILQYRVIHKLPTLYTSNYDYDQLEEHLAYSQKGGIEQMKAKRIMERIRHYTRAYFMEGPNRRTQMK